MSTKHTHRDGCANEPSPTNTRAAKTTHKGKGKTKTEAGSPPQELKKTETYHKAQGAAAVLALPAPRPRFALAAATGSLLYDLGFSTEYRLLQAWRLLRNTGLMAGQVFLWLFDLMFGWVAVLGADIWRDLTDPFRQLRRQRRLLEEQAPGHRTGGNALAKVRVKASLRFFSALTAVLMPLAAAAVLVLTVYNVLTMQYALEVEIDGQVIGYVQDQTVVDSAKSLLRGRIKLADNQQISDWQLTPTYTIARASDYTNSQELTNEILRLGSTTPGEIMEATGLYTADNELIAATEDGERLKRYLDQYLAQKSAEAEPGVTVSYVNSLACDPGSEEVFFTDSVLSWDEMLEKLNANVTDAHYVTANGEENLAQIAAENNLSQELILSRNPDLAGFGLDYVPPAGKSIKLENAQPLLQVQETRLVPGSEEIPYETVEDPDPSRAYGTRLPVQQGAPGYREFVDEYVYVDGELRARNRVQETVVQQAVPEIISVGTNPQTAVGANDYMFPVPGSTWSSRGISSYHRGLDINASTGEPIFACQAGTVIEAGWHYSFGYYVLIDHGNGMTTRYAHCSQLNAQAGQQVQRGDLIGLVGSTGNSTGPHCHLEFELNGALVNPLDYIAPPPGYDLH